jgi:crotonobetainyl-CoA:carnitine CoA-transferase CaiB-like acyl-CoA transferase
MDGLDSNVEDEVTPGPPEPPGGPLKGVRVLEVSTGRVGGMAGMLLADLGAEVVAVVPPGSRRSGPAQPAEVCYGRGKRHIEATDEEIAGLAARADVMLVNATPGEAERRRLTSDAVHARAPDLVHVWLPPYGESGEWRDLPEDPLFLAALTSLAVHLPADDDSPVAPVVSTLSSIQAAIGAAAAVAGLVGRCRSGTAQPAIVTGLHAGAALMGTAFTEIDDEPAFAPSRAITPAPNWRTYACADGQRIFLAALTPHLFFRALEAIDRLDIMAAPEVAGDFQSILDLRRGRRAVTAALEPIFAARTSSEWLDQLREARVPCALVQSREEWIAGTIIADNDARIVLEHPLLGPVTMPNVPIDFSETPGRVRGVGIEGAAGGPQWAPRPGPGAAVPPSTALPLDGVRVLDVSSFLAAPLGAELLADFGADVVRVEPPLGDAYRTYPLSFLAVNQRKLGLTLDLDDPAAGDLVHRLLSDVDVLVENLRPPTRARLDLDDCASRHPKLVHCSVSAFGRSEQWADVPGFDPLLQSLSGMARAQGGAGDPIVGSAGVNDANTGSLTALGVVAALFWRERSGRGQRVWTSLAVGSTYAQAAEFTTWPGSPPPPQGHELFRGPDEGHRYYECADGWIATGATDEPTRAAMLAALDSADFMAASEVLHSLPVATAVGRLARRGIPACRVVPRSRPLLDPFLEANGFSHLVAVPDGVARVVNHHSRWPAAAEPRAARYFEAGDDNRLILSRSGIGPEQPPTPEETSDTRAEPGG